MKYTRLDPPAFLNDFKTEAQRCDWSDQVSGYFRAGVRFNEGFTGVTSQFYHPVLTETDEPYQEALIDSPGFPKLVKDAYPTDAARAWRTAEEGAGARARYQDEYLEWHVVRNAAGKITRVSFTCETTQYFEFLAKTDPARLLAVYEELVDPAFKGQVRIEDLVTSGRYQGRNPWNTRHGAIHLIQSNNNLFAEVQIAAQACILRERPDGTPITDSDELINCADYGAPGRASNPRIGAIVNESARDGYSISLRNPVALYITQWSSSGWKRPNGSPVGNYWKLLRGRPAQAEGDPAMGLHLVYEVPPEEGFVVGDIKIGNRHIEYGGQIAENIRVGLFGLLCRQGATHNPAFTCGVRPKPAGGPIAHAAPAGVKQPPLRGAASVDEADEADEVGEAT